MRGDHESPIRPFLKKLFVAFFLKARVSDRNKLVDQVTVKLDGKRKAKCKSSSHARRVMLGRLLERVPKLSEIVYSSQGFLIVALI